MIVQSFSGKAWKLFKKESSFNFEEMLKAQFNIISSDLNFLFQTLNISTKSCSPFSFFIYSNVAMLGEKILKIHS
jgi:hypothetical protein